MTYWRMQLHPNDASLAAHYSVNSLAAGFIGLDFGEDPGDLTRASRSDLPKSQADFHDFANMMEIGDVCLVVLHHYPFAVATLDSAYNYIRTPAPELGVWFRHFRRVRDVKYYADRVTNPKHWVRTVMTDTISTLGPNTRSARLIAGW